MKTRVVHCKKSLYDVYIGRPSKWGNPFSHKEDSQAEYKTKTRKEAIEKYKEWIIHQPHLLKDLHELKGKTLGCWCAPKPCHGNILADMSNKIIKVGIVGSRSRNSESDKQLIKDILVDQLNLGRKLYLVSGGCWTGADKFAEELAEELQLGISIHAVDTSKFPGKIPTWKYAELAYARNTLIAEEADVIIASWDGISGGTADTLKKAGKLGKPIICV